MKIERHIPNAKTYNLRYTAGSKIIRALAIVLVIILVIILAVFSGLIANFYPLMLVIKSIKSNDHDLTNIYFIKLH